MPAKRAKRKKKIYHETVSMPVVIASIILVILLWILGMKIYMDLFAIPSF